MAEKTVTKRINEQRKLKADMKLDKLPEAPLMSFDGSSHTDVHVALPFTREDYFEPVDAMGRIIREDKKGFIPSEVPPVLLRFGIQPHKWLDHVKNFSRSYGHCAGSVARMRDYTAAFDKRWCKGLACRKGWLRKLLWMASKASGPGSAG